MLLTFHYTKQQQDMKDIIQHIKKWITINKGYLYLMLITMVITILGLIAGLEAGLSAGVACTIICIYGNVYNYITSKEQIDLKEIGYTLIGMIIPVTIYILTIL